MSIATVITQGFGSYGSIGFVVRTGFGVADPRIDTHDGDHYVPHGKRKTKFAKGQHLFGTYTRKIISRPDKEKKILEQVKQIAKEIKEAQKNLPSPNLQLTPRSEADLLALELKQFEELQNKLAKIEHAIEIYRNQYNNAPQVSEEELAKYQFLLDEENQIVALHYALAQKIKQLSDEEEEALMLLMTH